MCLSQAVSLAITASSLRLQVPSDSPRIWGPGSCWTGLHQVAAAPGLLDHHCLCQSSAAHLLATSLPPVQLSAMSPAYSATHIKSLLFETPVNADQA